MLISFCGGITCQGVPAGTGGAAIFCVSVTVLFMVLMWVGVAWCRCAWFGVFGVVGYG